MKNVFSVMKQNKAYSVPIAVVQVIGGKNYKYHCNMTQIMQ